MNRVPTRWPHRMRLAAPVLALALVAPGCTGDDPEAATTSTPTSPAASPSTTASPTASESTSPPRRNRRPRRPPVEGRRVVHVTQMDPRGLLGFGPGEGPDQRAINRATRVVGRWLDSHLDRLQRTNKGRFERLAAPDLRPNAKDRRIITTGLASRKKPVKRARYTMTTYHDGSPEYLGVLVRVVHPDDSVSRASLVFLVREDGTPVLTLFGPAPRKR